VAATLIVPDSEATGEPELGAGLAWAAAALGSPLVAAEPLEGGWTSAMLALTTQNGRRAVLRLMVKEPWRTHGAGLTTRESGIQRLLADTVVPAPTSLALDADGSTAGHPAHLMSLLPGRVDLDRVGADDLGTLADLLVAIHAIVPSTSPRDYQSWAWPAKYVVPEWARHPGAWEQAFAVLGGDPPAYEPTFLHRDFHLRNVLWEGDRISGVVDWVETSWGPAWLDVAHCRTNLAIHHGTVVADRFAELYVARCGREPAAYWDVMDVVGFLPPPDRPGFITDPDERRRLEDHLVAVLR
jgi:aminoglycoside phosphotransferase (APT) family kinase protein